MLETADTEEAIGLNQRASALLDQFYGGSQLHLSGFACNLEGVQVKGDADDNFLADQVIGYSP